MNSRLDDHFFPSPTRKREVFKRADPRGCFSPRQRCTEHATLDRDLTTKLAEKVMGWRISRDRFMTGEREWIPIHRFQPTERIGDAYKSLERARPTEYSICASDTGVCHVRIRIGTAIGEACDESPPRAVTIALANALGITVGACA